MEKLAEFTGAMLCAVFVMGVSHYMGLEFGLGIVGGWVVLASFK